MRFNYALTEVDKDDAYFHAQFRRTNPLQYLDDYAILDGVKGQGQYVGTYMAWQQNSTGWWGEGEVKFFIDGDAEFPTICGTGTEDYFGGAWCFGQNYSAPFLGYPFGACDGKAGNRHGLYRSTCPTRSGSRRISRSRCRPSAGAARAATCRSRTTSRPWPTGTRPNRTSGSRPWATGTSSK